MSRNGKMIEEIIDSNYLKETMKLLIYLPESFSPMNEFHVCIMQDGDDYYQLGRVATFSDQLHDEADILDTVFVGIHYQDKYDRRRKYHPSGEEQAAYIQFLTKEVIEKIEKLLPNHQLKSRALMGDSLAGSLALITACQYPNLFSKVIMQSPFVDEVVMETVKQAKKLHHLDIYHTIGELETNVQTLVESDVDFLTPNRQLKSFLEQNGGSYLYKEIPNGKHTWKFWQADLPEALRIMFE